MRTVQHLQTELMQSAIVLARKNQQTVGEKNDYYITLQQLEALLLSIL